MNDASDNQSRGGNVRTLETAMRRVRTAEAERSDVVVDLRDAERARLEMLADELKGVFAEVPEDNDTFLFAVAPGSPSRLWIDMTSFVVIGRDRRTYRFLKDTRLGRTVIVESTVINEVADCVTEYVAERIVERERAIEGDWVIRRVRREADQPGDQMRPPMPAAPMGAPGAAHDRRWLGWVAAAFLFGILLGVIGLFAYAWVRVPFT